MKNFNWSSFTRKIAIRASLSDIYNAWTKPSNIEKWFLSEAVFYRGNNEPLEKTESILKNDSYEWHWYLFEGVEKGKILEANGMDFLQFTFAGECIVDVNLKQESEYVIVSLSQRNIPTDEDSKIKIRLDCDSGWSFYLLNLKSIYEGGLDLRNKDAGLKQMLNN